MQNLADMLIESYSYLRFLLYIKNVKICFYSAMVQKSIIYNKALPHIIYTISCFTLFYFVILCYNTVLCPINVYIYIYIHTQPCIHRL